MSYKIVADSGCDLNPELAETLQVHRVPLTIYVGGQELRDDDNLQIPELLRLMRESAEAPRTACPSPHDFYEAYQGDHRGVFVVTLSSKLSGTFESAVLAKQMLLESGSDKFIHVFDSQSASIGETLVSCKIFELVKQNCHDLEIVEKVTQYIKEMKTFFLLESLDHLVKSGRVSKVVGKLASVLSVKLIMGDDGDGSIRLVEKVRGAQKAFRRFVEIIGEQGERLEEKVLGIAHCNALERAEEFKREILKRFKFKDVIIVEMSGLSSVYADEGGIVVAF